MGDISNLMIRNKSIEELNLLGNKIATAESLRMLLLGMVNNMSINVLHYKIDQFLIAETQGKPEEYLLDKKEIEMLEQQLKMNKFIREVIIPDQEKKRALSSPTLDLSHILINDHVEAVVKYFRLKK